jgi:hypothetical protein
LLGTPVDGAEPVFILQAPVMMDADGEMALAEMGFADDGTLMIRADAEFMSTAAFPVTISPSIRTREVSNLSMRRVSSGITVGSNNYVGRGSNTTHRTYVFFDLPNLPCGSVVLEAVFSVFQRGISNFTAGNYICLFAIPMPGTVGANDLNWHRDRLNWSRTGVNWSGQPFIGTPRYALRYIVDFSPLPNSSNTWHHFNITNTVRNWYENNSNNGLVFTALDETRSARARLAQASTRPEIAIRYTTNVSLQPHLTYETFDMGRSGTAFVNVHNGNMTWVHETISMPGERLPIQISHIYNTSRNNFSGVYQNMRLNPGFRLNIIEQLIGEFTRSGTFTVVRTSRYTLN